MHRLTMAALGALLLLGCNDDDDDDTEVRADGSVDASSPDSGRSLDASAPTDAGVGGARATLESKSSSNVTGTATFTSVNGVVTLTLSVTGASAGEHGAHIHVTGDCSAPNASSAGAHWNPDMHTHGSGLLDASTSSHLGDLGNIVVAADGKGTLTISKPEWKIGDGSKGDVLGHAVVVHANEDDLTTQDGDAGPGNSGGRQACGVIQRN